MISRVLLEIWINAFTSILSTLKFVEDSFSNQFEFVLSPLSSLLLISRVFTCSTLFFELEFLIFDFNMVVG